MRAVTQTVEQLADFLLCEWSRWIRDGTWLGLPRRSITESANEGGIGAGSPRPPSDMPDEVAATDRAVAMLGLRQESVLRRVVYLRYERNLPLEGISNAMNCTRRQANEWVLRAQRAVYRNSL